MPRMRDVTTIAFLLVAILLFVSFRMMLRAVSSIEANYDVGVVVVSSQQKQLRLDSESTNAELESTATTITTVTTTTMTTTTTTTTSSTSNSGCHEGRISSILRQALLRADATTTTTNEASLLNCTAMPTWDQVCSLYGDSPVIIGLERCEAYRRNHSRGGGVPRIAGLYNSGTNAMAALWETNWKQQNMDHRDQENDLAWLDRLSHFKWDVPWGKHVPIDQRWSVTVPPFNPTPKNAVLPIVIIRDPFWWMQSMCRNKYGAKWHSPADHRCPNLVTYTHINHNHSAFPRVQRAREVGVPVTTKYSFGKQSPTPIRFHIQYESLVHLWDEYYQGYLNDPLPRLLIRFEDLLFHGPDVLQAISECAGIPWNPRHYEYSIAPSKHHNAGSNTTGFVSALLKYGSPVGRITPYHPPDLNYAIRELNRTLLNLLRYSLPTVS